MMEIKELRDYYVENIVSKKINSNNRSSLSDNLLSMRVYEREFLKQFKDKYDIQGPTVVKFIKTHLLYQEDMSPTSIKKRKLKGDTYTGYVKPDEKLPQVSEEIIEMEKVLDELSKVPRRSSISSF